MKLIMYPADNGAVMIVVPLGELPIEQVALKDVPAGKPFKYVDQEQLPDHTFLAAWEADFSNPDGHGIGADAWFAMQEEKA